MEELKYRKVQCSSGHWSPVFGIGESLPPRCPVCGRPYDRRRNRPVSCLSDGTIPDENTKNTSESALYQESVEAEPVSNVSEEQTVENQGMDIRSERRSAGISRQPEQSVRRRRVVESSEEASVLEHRNPTTSQVQRQSINTQTSRYVIWCSGESMVLEEGGNTIGRKGNFSRLCSVNRLISREHALLTPEYRGVKIRDMNSLNGTYIRDENGRRRLQKEESVVLRAKDVFWLADQMFVLDEEN